MWAPDGIATHKGECWEVLKSLYGGKGAGADWKATLTQRLYKFEIRRMQRNTSSSQSTWTIQCASRPGARRIRSSRSSSVTSLTPTTRATWLGFCPCTTRSTEGNVMSLDQKTYVEKMIKDYGFEEMKTAPTPMADDFKITESNLPDKVNSELQNEFRRLLGSLLFIGMWSRPDISFTVYLKGTSEYGIGYTNDQEKMKGFSRHELWGYVDSSYTDDEITRKSTYGYVIFLNEGPISWKVKLSPLIVLSTADSEFVEACYAACEIKFLRQLLDVLGFTQHKP
eukprot:3912214-Rhodomonas_salina.1